MLYEMNKACLVQEKNVALTFYTKSKVGSFQSAINTSI